MVRQSLAISPQEQMERLEVAEQAALLQDRCRMFKSVQASVDAHQKQYGGVDIPEDDVINTGNINIYPDEKQPPRNGLSALAAVGLGLLAAAVPTAGVIGYLMRATPAIEKVIHVPGVDYDVNVGMEVVPPKK